MKTVDICELRAESNEPIVLAVDWDDVKPHVLEYFENDSQIYLRHLDNPSVKDIFWHGNMAGRHKICVILVPYDADIMMTKIADIRITQYVLLRNGVQIGTDAAIIPEAITRVTTNSEDLRHDIMQLFGWAKFPVFPMERESKLQEQFLKNYRSSIMSQINYDHCEFGLDAHGHVIIRSKDTIWSMDDSNKLPFAKTMGISQREAEYMAYVGTSFITLPKEDARAVADLLDEVCEERSPDGDSYEAFEEQGLSYERLHDRLTGLIYWH